MLTSLKYLILFISRIGLGKFFLTVFFSLVASFLDFIGIASVGPLLSLLLSSESGMSSFEGLLPQIVFDIFMPFFDSEPSSFIYILMVCLGLSIVGKALSVYIILWYSLMCERDLCSDFYKRMCWKNLNWFADKKRSDLSQMILSQLEVVATQSIMSVIQAISQGTVVFALVILIYNIAPADFITISSYMVLFFSIYYVFTARYVGLLGLKRLISSRRRYELVNIGSRASRLISVFRLQKRLSNGFARASESYAVTQIKHFIIETLPRYILELSAFGLGVILILNLESKTQEFEAIIPVVAGIGASAYRLLPALQQTFSCVSRIKFASESVISAGVLFFDSDESQVDEQRRELPPLSGKIEKVRLDKISFTYDRPEHELFDEISIQFAKGHIYGLRGQSGSGKSTLADMIAGLQQPSSGCFWVNDVQYERMNPELWGKRLALVPQDSIIFNGTILENLTFDFGDHELPDLKKEEIFDVLALSNLDNWVNSLEKGLDTELGDEGSKVSGGQKQRIGIARGLLFNPDVLILDEGTSSLDQTSEKIIMENLHQIKKEKIIIMIAHRHSTLGLCDKIIDIEKTG